jgi:hypothetical protein
MLRVIGLGPKKYAVNAGFRYLMFFSQKSFAIYIEVPESRLNFSCVIYEQGPVPVAARSKA